MYIYKVEDAVFEVYAEEFIEEEVIKAELAEEIPDMAKEVLTHFDTKVMRRELKEVSYAPSCIAVSVF